MSTLPTLLIVLKKIIKHAIHSLITVLKKIKHANYHQIEKSVKNYIILTLERKGKM